MWRPELPSGAAPTSVTLEAGSLRSGTAASLSADDSAFYSVNSSSDYSRTTSWYGTFTGVPSTLRSLNVAYKGSNSSSCTQTLSAWSFQAGSWAQLDSRTVDSNQVLIERSTTGNPGDYVGPGGEVRVRVRCTVGFFGSAFVANGNLLRITYTQ